MAKIMLESAESTACRSQFIAFVREKYGNDIRSLNAAWGTGFEKFNALSKPFSSDNAGFTADTEAFTKIMIHQ